MSKLKFKVTLDNTKVTFQYLSKSSDWPEQLRGGDSWLFRGQKHVTYDIYSCDFPELQLDFSNGPILFMPGDCRLQDNIPYTTTFRTAEDAEAAYYTVIRTLKAWGACRPKTSSKKPRRPSFLRPKYTHTPK